ncbi:MAG: 4'-phosphopantetheinyl transferase superfamily protein [Bacillota bacterium]|nr:4'-phosphopantetheinyl transferase superfamily protein [Bacillota bacterium]
MKIFMQNIDWLKNENKLSKYIEQLPEVIRNKALKAKSQRRKAEIAVGFFLARIALEQYGAEEGKIKYADNGKPYVSGAEYNLSHSGSLVVAAASEKPVGIDIQKTVTYKKRVAGKFCCDEEINYIEKSENKDVIFTCLWALKEALCKTSGAGLGEFLKGKNLTAVLQGDTVSGGLNYYMLRIDGYVLAVCSEGEITPEIIIL